MSTPDEIWRADFEYLTGRHASAEEIAGSGTIRMHYENDGSIRHSACTAVDYHDPDIRARLEVRYPPENSPLIKALVEAAMSAARNDPDGSKLAASKALTAAAEDWAVEHLSYTTATLRDDAVPFDAWVEEVTRRLQPPMTRGTWWSNAFREHVAATHWQVAISTSSPRAD